MLQQALHPNGVVTYQSPRLATIGVPHAFTTRVGGVSCGPFASLNLNNQIAVASDGDVESRESPAHVEENYRRLKDALHVTSRSLAWADQVHGSEVAVVNGSAGRRLAGFDALVTRSGDVLLSVRVADCAPILLADRTGPYVAAVHAGWRGVVGGAVRAAIVKMVQQFGCRPGDLVAAIGPCITVDHFEVGPEVAAAFEQAGLGDVVRAGERDRSHLDLPLAVVRQLVDAGVERGNIDGTDRCSFRDESLFFSHRRDDGVTGRMAAVIAVPTDR